MEIFAREAESSRDLPIAMVNASMRINIDSLTLSMESNDPRPTR